MATLVDVLNVAKVITVMLILLLMGVYGLSDLRKVVYSSLHLSYLAWWFLHQWAAPGWIQAVFGVPWDKWEDRARTIGVFGIFYALPAWCAFANPAPISAATAIVGTILFMNGSALNIASDFYKTAQKQAGVKKVCTHIFDGRLGRNPNHVGDWMRYSSFALVSGTWLAWLVPAYLVYFNISSVMARGAAANQ